MITISSERRHQIARTAKVVLIVVAILVFLLIVVSLIVRAIALDADGTRVRHRFFVVGFFRRFGYR
jgi:hypothetical protein